MPHFMVHDVDPVPRRFVFTSAFPVLGVNQLDLAVFISFARGFAPVDILVPLEPGALKAVELTEQRNCPPELRTFVFDEKVGQRSVDDTAGVHRRQ